MLELLYGTGIRRSELLHLCINDVNLCECTIKVLGKRQKERIIPFPKSIKEVIKQYIAQREQCKTQSRLLLLTDKGTPCYPMLIDRLVKKYLSSYTHANKYSPHVLRHTFATHLLNKGADLKAIKDLLGHANLSATQVYTHNSLTKLKGVFQQAHPRAMLAQEES